MKFYLYKYNEQQLKQITAEETLTYISEKSYLKGINEKSLDIRKDVIGSFDGGLIIFEI